MTDRPNMRHGALQDAGGFTLVEAIVAGTISLLVVWVAITVYFMSTRQISGGFSRSLSNMQYQTVIDQIGATVRKAAMISATNQALLDPSGVDVQTDQIFLFDVAGNCGGFQRNGTALLEWNVIQFVNFRIGSKNVKVTDTGANNTFTIAADRKSVRLNLSVFYVDGKSSDTVVSKQETFQCRN